MAGRTVHDSRNFTLPDLNSDSRLSSPVSSIASMARPQPTMLNKPENQFILPSQAFVPIKDSFAVSQKEAKKREMEVIFQQQSKLQEKIKELETSNQHLLSEVNSLKRMKENHSFGNQAEHALRSATDMTIYLSKKLQDIHETVTKLEVRLEQQEKKLVEEKGGMTSLVGRIVELEANNRGSLDNQLIKHNNDMAALRDLLQDLRQRLLDEQMERKMNEQKVMERLNKQREELQHLQQQQLRSGIPVPQKQHSTITPKLEEKMVELAEDVFKKHNIMNEKLKEPIVDAEKLQAEVGKIMTELEALSKKCDDKLADLKKELDEGLENTHQTLKSDRIKINQELKTIKESINLVAGRQIDQYKAMQEKLQTETLTRQQFECDTLRQMTILDDKIIKFSSSLNPPIQKTINSGKSELVIKEVDSLKKLIVETEKNLEQKIENSIQKLKPSPRSVIVENSKIDLDVKQELEVLSLKLQKCQELGETNVKQIHNMNLKIENCQEVGETNTKHVENLSTKVQICQELGEKNAKHNVAISEWKTNVVEKTIKELSTEVDSLKHQVEAPAVNGKDNEILLDVNRRVLMLEEFADDYKVFKQLSNDNVEDLRRRIRSINEKPKTPKSADDKSNNAVVEPSIDPEWKERIDVTFEEVQKEITKYKEKTLQHEQKLLSLKKEIDSETQNRTKDVEELKHLMKDHPPPEAKPNSAKEGLRKLANALQGTKNMLALKMQQELKERANAIEHIQKRLEDLDNTVDTIDGRLVDVENKVGSGKENPNDKGENLKDKKEPPNGGKENPGSTGKNPSDNKDGGKDKAGKSDKKDNKDAGKDPDDKKKIPNKKKE